MFVFTHSGGAAVDARLARYIFAVRDAAPAFEILGERFVAMEQKQFASEGAWGGAAWAPLSPAYASWKARHYPGKPILQLGGTLIDSLTIGPKIREIGPTFATFGTDVSYAQYHQQGTPKMPQRKPLDITLIERRFWVEVIRRWITGVGNPRPFEGAVGAGV